LGVSFPLETFFVWQEQLDCCEMTMTVGRVFSKLLAAPLESFAVFNDHDAPRKRAMLVHRELSSFGEPPALEAMVEKTESRLANGWFRDRQKERKLHLPGDSRSICFVLPAKDGLPDIALVLNLNGRCLRATNIVPNGKALSLNAYNSLLVQFYLAFLQPAASEAGVQIQLSSAERTIDEAFGWNSVEALKSFSQCANKERSHPADRLRWLDFLVTLRGRRIHCEELDVLAEWLIADGWPDDKVRKMISESEFASEFLRAICRNEIAPLPK